MHVFLPASQVVAVSSSNLFTLCSKTCKLPVAKTVFSNQVPTTEPQPPKNGRAHIVNVCVRSCHSLSLQVYY